MREDGTWKIAAIQVAAGSGGANIALPLAAWAGLLCVGRCPKVVSVARPLQQRQQLARDGRRSFCRTSPAVAFLQEVACDLEGLDADGVPPGRLVAAVVEVPIVLAAKRDREVITDLPSHRPWLRIANVVGVWPSTIESSQTIRTLPGSSVKVVTKRAKSTCA